MSEVEVIAAALAAGAAAGTTATASTAVQDAYKKLKKLLRSRFADRPDAQFKLSANKKRAAEWLDLIGADLQDSGAGTDPEVLRAANSLLDVVPGTVVVNVAGSVYGSQAGNGNIATNYFGVPEQ
jgi:hypothetical protein